jgi:hypothetical protein
MSTTWLPCGKYHETYAQDHAWFQTHFIRESNWFRRFVFNASRIDD